jgi:hypothetical protein
MKLIPIEIVSRFSHFGRKKKDWSVTRLFLPTLCREELASETLHNVGVERTSRFCFLCWHCKWSDRQWIMGVIFFVTFVTNKRTKHWNCGQWKMDIVSEHSLVIREKSNVFSLMERMYFQVSPKFSPISLSSRK